ncbi:Type II restriction endonuclease TdeIII [Helicobacter sp. NHP19-003]|uniref:type II site-specific deoxyribonuclease n=1 Tax=Helicobacter gastrocanis TaxID=2849641 RepID=A0ABM7SIW9_9HELI|nr:TdeIII family type II restriction endonuclease [Helicobacter sp. NHP19-003]BCZ18020.1 Type II restriction endonuclease TdeIII [Helicobacter sp. NHP19-003]
MPFHTRLLGKDRMALYSFIHSLSTNFGSSIFEPVAKELGCLKFDRAELQTKSGDRITPEAQQVIQDIMNCLETATNKPNKACEIAKILKAMRGAIGANTIAIKPTKVDLRLAKNGSVYLIDLKTAKPNMGEFKGFKRTLLTWVAAFAYDHPNITDIHTLIAIPYNPYAPKPYERWTLAGMLDLKHELMVGKDFWDFVGGEGSYTMLLECFEEVGLQMRDEIDAYFKKFMD